MYINKVRLTPEKRTFFCFDNKDDKIIKYDCMVKEDVDETDIGYLCSSLYAMKLTTVNSGILQEGKTTCNLIHEIENIISSPIMSFKGLISMFNMDVAPKEVVEVPIKGILNLFDIEKKEVLPEEAETVSKAKESLVDNTIALEYFLPEGLINSKTQSDGKKNVKVS